MDQQIELRMIWDRWRPRVIYLLMSAFVAWHALALVIAPVPGSSELVDATRAVLQPYLTLLRMDNPWSFFAPTIEGAQLHYIVEDAAGTRAEFGSADHTSWFHPEDLWLKDWNYSIMDDPDLYASHAGEMLCRKHAAIHPASITFVQRVHSGFKPEDWLNGKRPQDAEFTTETTGQTVQCPAP
jgi:hypothetical protein